MSAQTSYAINIRTAIAGMLVDLHNHDIISRSIETVAGVGFGVVVSRGTDKDNQAVIGGTVGILGVTVRSLDREGAANTGLVKYSEKETAGILRDGYIYAVCPSGCNPGDPVNFVEATGVLDSGAPAGVGETGLDDCFWDSTAAAGELAVLRVKNVNQITAGI
tara:strand:- start:871 stop:1359 length:489 start_codon:yes stop_codon:yes gene_type:complete